jgi:hypothetical protein
MITYLSHPLSPPVPLAPLPYAGQLWSVDGMPVNGMGPDGVWALLQGPPGAILSLVVRRVPPPGSAAAATGGPVPLVTVRVPCLPAARPAGPSTPAKGAGGAWRGGTPGSAGEGLDDSTSRAPSQVRRPHLTRVTAGPLYWKKGGCKEGPAAAGAGRAVAAVVVQPADPARRRGGGGPRRGAAR